MLLCWYCSATIDESVRQILVPHLPDESSSGFTRLSTAAELHTASSVPATSGSPAASASSADMDALHSMLLRSNKRDAVRYALDHRLWGHALIIASAVDEELKSSVVREFLQAELPDSSGNRKALKVAYSLFAGVGPSSSEKICKAEVANSVLDGADFGHLPASSPTLCSREIAPAAEANAEHLDPRRAEPLRSRDAQSIPGTFSRTGVPRRHSGREPRTVARDGCNDCCEPPCF